MNVAESSPKKVHLSDDQGRKTGNPHTVIDAVLCYEKSFERVLACLLWSMRHAEG